MNLYSDLDFCEIDENEKNIPNLMGIDKNTILEPSFLMFFSEKDNKLVLNRIMHKIDIYGNAVINNSIKYVFGKIYYKDDSGNFRVRYVNCKMAEAE